uniref:Cytochrome c oxidase subunit 2 n=1 Tax=Dicyema misakiense TaxID=10218 RepID=Q9XKD8_9BILA|nr:cytochrome c oxidase subunit II [Dicyema misakiense]
MLSGFVDSVFPSSEVFMVHDIGLCVLMMAVVPSVLWVSMDVMSWMSMKVNLMLNDESLSRKVELVWTVIPVLMLMILASSSVSSLYQMDNVVSECTIKLMGNQWYWSWEYDFKYDSFEGNSYVSNDDFNGCFYALDVDNRLVVPMSKYVELIVSSSDVLHSFALPSLGIKLDAVPGRIMSIMLCVDLPSALYGQCSEMCGTGHALMPLCIESIPMAR